MLLPLLKTSTERFAIATITTNPMANDYIVLFRGSNIEAGRILFDLEEIGIRGVLRDQQTSAARSGFAIPATSDEAQVLVHREEHEKAKSIL